MILILAFNLFASSVFASDWIATTGSTLDAHRKAATITSYNKKCVEVKTDDGKKYSLNREGFKGVDQLVSGATQVQIHPETAGRTPCSEK